jgi:hypothetical protein
LNIFAVTSSAEIARNFVHKEEFLSGTIYCVALCAAPKIRAEWWRQLLHLEQGLALLYYAFYRFLQEAALFDTARLTPL